MRKPIAAGKFYAATKSDLNKQIESCFKHRLGAGMPKVPLREKEIYGLIVPHAGYAYSGPCASHAYKELAQLNKENFPDTFIILGPNHSGFGKSLFSLTFEDFETPLGVMKNDTKLGKKILEQTSHLGLQEDSEAHRFEHSIEVQIPFIQFISKIVKKEQKPKIVPIVISTLEYNKCLALGRKISGVIEDEKKENKKICIIASSDFTHYGLAYGFLPFNKDEAKIKIKELDRKAIHQILKLNSLGFYNEAIKTTICGTAGIVTAMESYKDKVKKAKLLKYYSTYHIHYENNL